LTPQIQQRLFWDDEKPLEEISPDSGFATFFPEDEDYDQEESLSCTGDLACLLWSVPSLEAILEKERLSEKNYRRMFEYQHKMIRLSALSGKEEPFILKHVSFPNSETGCQMSYLVSLC
jgi:hypothetical protein